MNEVMDSDKYMYELH